MSEDSAFKKSKRAVDLNYKSYHLDPNVVLQVLKGFQGGQPRMARQLLRAQIEQEVTRLQNLHITGREFTYPVKQSSNTEPPEPIPLKKRSTLATENLPLPAKQARPRNGSIRAVSHTAVQLASPHQAASLTSLSEQSNEIVEEMANSNPTIFAKAAAVYRSERPKPSHVIRSIPKRGDSLQPKKTLFLGMNPAEARKVNQFILYREFGLAVSLSNYVLARPEQEALYKAFVSKGNNGLLVKSIIKCRPWWSIRAYTDVDNCNLVWTEWKRSKVTDCLPQVENRQSLSQSADTQRALDPNLKQIMGASTNIVQTYCTSAENSDTLFTFGPKLLDSKFFDSTPKQFPPNLRQLAPSKERRMANHIPGCNQFHSKRLLFRNVKRYLERKSIDPWTVLPETYLISKGVDEPDLSAFEEVFQGALAKSNKKQSVWICKPGDNSNRGNGIAVTSTVEEIRAYIRGRNARTTTIVQKYMETPCLYNRRKFDIRCYILVTCVNGVVKGYWYQEGYVRTASKEYNLKNLDNKLVHLTNDAIQKKGEDYGKYESCNKVSFAEFEKYCQTNYQGLPTFQQSYERMRLSATWLIESVADKINPQNRQFCFELFGLDFMLDSQMNVYLIEGNSNPCLEVDGVTLGRVIPTMVENAIKVAIDPVFPPPFSEIPASSKYSPGNSFQQNKFELVYDSMVTPILATEPIEKERDEQEQQNQPELYD